MLTRYSADQIDVTEWKDVDDLTAGSKVTKVPRLAYDGFSLIYRDGAFHHRSSDGSVDAHAEMPKIVATKNGYDVSYVYGMSEGNSWHFEKHDGCWLLTADPQPFSP